ncbi:unnamed protein product [Eruca vesicaria subsp. sativa]|uniref:Protein kinase domain-containing protein n=1 Tax=Eruca vesicaria subsp. sativa TaxID=29727 RepID=A0ABC8JKI7_ERUVS|nr:unnamed protein product [Eruca vesicaria subsp. sativa]
MKSQVVIKWVLVLIGAIIFCIEAETINEDKHTLLQFVSSISHSHSLNWSPTLPICTKWTGVTCDSHRSSVVGLHLVATGLLRGHGELSTIARLTNLRVLILSSNNISGPFPSSLHGFKNLAELKLDSNEFSGPLPSDFSSWEHLRVLDLSNNRFNASIPSSFEKLTQLHTLNLANNKFSGEIPNLHIPGLKLLDLAHNNLTGTVPKSLQRFPLSVFVGNNLIHVPTSLRRQTKHHHNHTVLGIVLSTCFVLLALLAIFLVISHNRETQRSTKEKPIKRRKDSDPNLGGGDNKIVFFEGKNLVFDLEDLLRASAEVLGKGPFGTTYKVDLEDSATIVVKRIKEVCVSQREFEQQIEHLGNIKHENVATLRGYYYSKDEKLVVYDYYEHGSLSSLLHGQRCLRNRKPLDWETRLNTVYGAAKGVAHIHSQSGGKLVHGNIKSSNVFLNAKGNGCISGAGMSTLMHSLPRHAFGYRAPEITDTRKGSQPSDVYSFGVLIFEVLTGKSEVANLVRWVNSVVREEWTGEVFDEELMRCTQVEEEMVEMLQIGMVCTAKLPEKRPNMNEVVRMVEEMRPEKLVSGNRSEVSTGSTPIGSLSGSPYIL